MPNMTPRQIAQEISKSPETQALLAGIAADIADEAADAANMMVGRRHVDKKQGGRPIPAEFGSQVNVGRTRARGYVWAKNGPAIHAERKESILPEIANQYGEGKTGRQSKKAAKKGKS